MQAHFNKKSFTIVVICLLALANICGCQSQEQSSATVTEPVIEQPEPAPVPFSPATTYSNWAVSISVPSSWLYSETRDQATGGGVMDFFAPGSTFNSLSITASALSKMNETPDIESEVANELENARALWGEITDLEQRTPQNDWNYYISFNSRLKSTNEKFHTAIYIKTTSTYYYLIKMSYSTEDSDEYPWDQVIETFTLASNP